MTDLEMTKLCAEAMGLSGHPVRDGMEMWTDAGWAEHKDALVLHHTQWQYWNPLHDDAQAMALVKKLGLWIDRDSESLVWGVQGSNPDEDFGTYNIDLNRAIVECVARMQAAKMVCSHPVSCTPEHCDRPKCLR